MTIWRATDDATRFQSSRTVTMKHALQTVCAPVERFRFAGNDATVRAP
jgi:hypothetical protein